MPITKKIWRGDDGTLDFGACNAIIPITSVPITSYYRNYLGITPPLIPPNFSYFFFSHPPLSTNFRVPQAPLPPLHHIPFQLCPIPIVAVHTVLVYDRGPSWGLRHRLHESATKRYSVDFIVVAGSVRTCRSTLTRGVSAQNSSRAYIV